MNININYFGVIAEITGKVEENIFLEQPTEVWRCNEILQEKYPTLKDAKYNLAINHSVEHDESRIILKDDELALLPPFAGG